MANAEADAGASETKKESTMALEEEVVVAAVEEAVVEEATATITVVEEVVATTAEAEVVTATTMDTRTTSIRGTNNTPSPISNNHQCPQQYLCRTLFQVAVHRQHTKATIWTAMQIKWVTMPTVAIGATKDNHNGRDRPHLVQRASS